MEYGKYKGKGICPWFGGKLSKRTGEPLADGPGRWGGEWFRTEKEADEYAAQMEREEREYDEEIQMYYQ